MRPITKRLRADVKRLLARMDLAVVRPSRYEQWREYEKPSYQPGPLPPGADAELRPDNPRLLELIMRYRRHPAAARSVWSDDLIEGEVDLRYFRGDNAYVWQHRLGTQACNYAITTLYLREHDPMQLLERLDEDGLFGADVHDMDGLIVSRDLLDSVTELTFLEEHLSLSKRRGATVLDIGAGYGRLAHRATAAFDLTYLCTDGVPQSTYLCDYYLRFRGASGAEVLPLDVVADALHGRHIDVAVNVHSFSECPLAAIEWWLDLIAANDVEHLFIVPNQPELLSTEESHERINFQPPIEARGFELVVKRPKYAYAPLVQAYGVAPATYYLFRRSMA